MANFLYVPNKYLIKGIRGDTGPYTAKQVALIAITSKKSLSDILIRLDNEEEYLGADNDPQVVMEFDRRGGSKSSKNDSTSQSPAENSKSQSVIENKTHPKLKILPV